MKKSEKPYFVENLAEELKSATGYILVDYSGLTVKMQQDLKKRLREVGGEMTIVKNSLFKLSAKNTKAPSDITSDTVLSGPTALIMTEKDPISVLQILSKFAKETEIMQFKVGIIEGEFRDKDSLVKLASLPGKAILQMQLLGAIQAPSYSLIGVLQGNLQKLIYVITEYKSKRV